MNLVSLYQCLCDETRLRILHLLLQRPLCVCHLQEILGRTQTQISQHLSRLKKDGLVEGRRHQNWMIYSLPEKKSPALTAHLQCLQACVSTEPAFKQDLKAMNQRKTECGWVEAIPLARPVRKRPVSRLR